jgi:hypothetical protein
MSATTETRRPYRPSRSKEEPTVIAPYAIAIANELTRRLATSALPDAPRLTEPEVPPRRPRVPRLRRLTATTLVGAADGLDPAAARARLAT